jgi:hypothetical protein
MRCKGLRDGPRLIRFCGLARFLLGAYVFLSVSHANAVEHQGVVDLDDPQALHAIEQSNPARYRSLRQILDRVLAVPGQRVPQWLKETYGATDISYETVGSPPATKVLMFSLEGERYAAHLTQNSFRASADPQAATCSPGAPPASHAPPAIPAEFSLRFVPGKAKRSASEIDEGFAKYKPAFLSYYGHMLRDYPCLQGWVYIALAIDSRGQVAGAQVLESTLHAAPVEDRLAELSRQVRFAPTAQPGYALIVRPFQFVVGRPPPH